MIPKIIHYCWFGCNPKPKLAEKCIKSWKKYCPDYEIIEWNEDNYDIPSAPLYVRQAYEAQKWAFVTDYVRLQVVYENGGIYLDTDVEIIKDLTPLLDCHAYFGFESKEYVATGLGFGAEKGASILGDMLKDYEGIPFADGNGSFDLTSCPRRNLSVFLQYGLIQNGLLQVLNDGIAVYPKEYFCPYSWGAGLHKTSNTYTIHWFSASWFDEEMRREYIPKVPKWKKIRGTIYTILRKCFISVLGQGVYIKIKKIIKKNDY